MSKKTLILDVDGVVRNVLPAILNCFNRTAVFPVFETDCKTYNLSFISDKKKFFVKHGRDIFFDSPMFPEAPKAINELEKSFEIVFVTSQYAENMDLTFQWLKNNDLLKNNRSVFFTWNKDDIKADIIVDDSPDNLRDHNAKHKFLFDAVYNRDCDEFPRIYNLFHLLYLTKELT